MWMKHKKKKKTNKRPLCVDLQRLMRGAGHTRARVRLVRVRCGSRCAYLTTCIVELNARSSCSQSTNARTLSDSGVSSSGMWLCNSKAQRQQHCPTYFFSPQTVRVRVGGLQARWPLTRKNKTTTSSRKQSWLWLFALGVSVMTQLSGELYSVGQTAPPANLCCCARAVAGGNTALVYWEANLWFIFRGNTVCGVMNHINHSAAGVRGVTWDTCQTISWHINF